MKPIGLGLEVPLNQREPKVAALKTMNPAEDMREVRRSKDEGSHVLRKKHARQPEIINPGKHGRKKIF